MFIRRTALRGVVVLFAVIATVGGEPVTAADTSNNANVHFELRRPIVKLGAVDSYFGASVALHGTQDGDNVLLVGAPLDEREFTNRSGAMYKCPLTNKTNDCQKIALDLHEFTSPTDAFNGEWMGGTVRSGGIGANVIVCAPRHIYIDSNNEKEVYYGRGRCLMLDQYLQRSSPANVVGCTTTCQLGMSAALVDVRTMVIGAPSYASGSGAAIVFEKNTDPRANFEYRTKNTKRDRNSMYLGMAVATGRFYDAHTVSYAVGAPGIKTNSSGLVNLYTFSSVTNNSDYMQTVKTRVFGSNFGMEVVAADMNGDSWSDLVVGAPHFMKAANENVGGAIFVYMNQERRGNKAKRWFASDPHYKAFGKYQSQFGLAIANLGDINNDNCDDIAVGAPYEGDGVVYIYLGSRKHVKGTMLLKPSQVIRPADLPPSTRPLLAFGHSLSGGIDLDGNGYFDLLIGSYQSAAVVALMARPPLNIVTEIRAPQLDPRNRNCTSRSKLSDWCFDMEVCTRFNSSRPIPVDLFRMSYTLEEDTDSRQVTRVFFDDRAPSVERKLDLYTNLTSCIPITVYLKDLEGNSNKELDIKTPIRFRVTYRLVEPLKDHSMRPNPIFAADKMISQHAVLFKPNCDECVAKLEVVSFHIDNVTTLGHHHYVLDTQSELSVHINVTNKGDTTYATSLHIEFDANLEYEFSDRRCVQTTSTHLECHLGNLFPSHKIMSTVFRFNPSRLQPGQSVFKVSIQAQEKTAHTDAPSTYTMLVERVARLMVRSRSRPEQIDMSNVTDVGDAATIRYLEDFGPAVRHIYNVINANGPSSAKSLRMQIEWPDKTAANSWLLYLVGYPKVVDTNGIQMGFCETSGVVNPLHLEHRNKTEIDEQDDADDWQDIDEVQRSRRSLETSPIEEVSNVTNSSLLYSAKDPNSTIISTIVCHVDTLAKGEQIFVHIVSRLSTQTALNIAEGFHVESTFSLTSDPSIAPIAATTQTYVVPRLPVPPSVPLWWILLAMFVGCVCFLLIAVGLSYCGFFKRNRVDPVLLRDTVQMADEVRQSVAYRTSMRASMAAGIQPRYSLMQRMSYKPNAPVPESMVKQRIRYSAFLENPPSELCENE